ncbi:MAG: hypothetical protein LC620_05335, partial [Halobacteriales archaeon]|nr:hypothetical protein [Halobacteriales archaeon]
VYPLTVRVTGGPAALPDPQAQGGFDLSTDGGALAGDPAQAGAFRDPSSHEVTYTAAGTHQREWRVTWTAPNLATRPSPIHLWLAVLAANGNHVIAANASDGGETFDAAASLVATVAPDPLAMDLWHALPLAPPVAHALLEPGGAWVVEGAHMDGNATSLLFRLDDGPWQVRATGREWRVILPSLEGMHQFSYRSDGDGRRSPLQSLDVGAGRSDSPAGHAAAAPAIPALAVILAAVFRRNPT